MIPVELHANRNPGITPHAVNRHAREIHGRLDVHSAADLRLRLLA